MGTYLVSVDVLVVGEDAVKSLTQIQARLEGLPITRVNVQKTTLEIEY